MCLNSLRVLLVFAIISSSVSVHIDFDEELPLYLTDDFLISKLGSISKRSVNKNAEIGSIESDTSRSEADKASGNPNNPAQIPKENNKQVGRGQFEEDESGLVFLPSFGRRTRRSVQTPELGINEEKQSPTSKSDKISSYSISDLDNEENGIVFLPSFGRRTRRYIIKRDISSTTNENNDNSETTERNEELINNESEDEQESGLVFLPSFGRSRRYIAKRSVSTENNHANANKKSAIENKDSEANKNKSEDAEESGLVFLPSFGRRTRRHVTSSSQDETNHNNQPTKVISELPKKESENAQEKEKTSTTTQKNENKSINESEVQESGLVFLPSFGRRTRRDISTNDPENYKYSIDEQGTENSGKSKSGELEDEEESGLVFIPSFNRRVRRELLSKETNKLVVKRDTDNKSSNLLNNNQEPQNKGLSEINSDMDESENGMVFLTSFGRNH